MPLEWGRDRDREAGTDPIPHLGAFAYHRLKAPVFRDKRAVRGKVTQYATSSSHWHNWEWCQAWWPCKCGFSLLAVSAVIQEKVWGNTLMSSCSICDMGAVLTPPNHPGPWHSPGAQPACDEFVQP